MTLTYPALNRARRILWLATGAEKAAMLARLAAGDHGIPAGRVERRAVVLADAMLRAAGCARAMTEATDGIRPRISTRFAINTIRTLSIDAVQAANSGHPGTPMALAPLVYTLWNRVMRFDPQDPIWPNRDRFVLSNGHASMLLVVGAAPHRHAGGERRVRTAR